MVSEIAVVCVVPPLVALMVMLRVPVRARVVTEIFTVDVPAPGAVMDVGVKAAVTPVGRPVAERETAALKPPATVVVTVEVPLLPLVTDTELGDTETAKLGVTVTVRLTVAVCVRPPPVPVMVIG